MDMSFGTDWQEPDVDSPWLEAAVKLREAATSLQARLQSLLAEHGLSPGQWHALNLLHRRGSARAGDAARALRVDVGAASRLFDELERRGWCRRERVAGDRRVITLTITDEGRAIVVDSGPRVEAALVAHFGGIGLDEMQRACRVLGGGMRTGEAGTP